MKIKNLIIYFLKVKKKNIKNPLPSFYNDGFVFIKLLDEFGNHGWGEPSPYICESKKMIKSLKDLYFKNFKDKKIKEIDLEKIKKSLKNKNMQKLIVCFHHAINEIIAKSKNKNVAQLFANNKKIKKIPMYASGGMIFEKKDYSSLISEAVEQKEKGFFGWKFRPSFPDTNLSHTQRIKTPPPFNLKKLIRFANKLREKVGSNFNLMLDCGSRCKSIEEAIYLSDALEELNFFFLEEPLPRKLDLYKKFYKRKSKLQIASGEDIATLIDFKRWKKNKVDIFQPDTNLLTFNEIHEIEKNCKQKIIFHNWCNPINFAINVSYIMSSDKNILLERNIISNPYQDFFQNNSFKINGGMIQELDCPGFGIQFNKIKNKTVTINETKI